MLSVELIQFQGNLGFYNIYKISIIETIQGGPKKVYDVITGKVFKKF